MKGKKFLIVFLLTLACTFGFTGCSFTGLSCGGVVDTPQNSTTLDSSQPNGHVHSWTETILQESECTKDGVAQYSCECGVQETRLIEATGHKYSETTVVKKPSCYSEGEDEKVCLTCGDEVKTVIQKTDHDYELIEATAVGLTYRCALCYDEKETQTAQDLMEQTQESYLFDVETDFSFTVKTSANEEYIRNNLKILNVYFDGSEYETNENVLVKYAVEHQGNGVWKISPISAYENGYTYIAKTRNDVSFEEYGGNNLTFAIKNEETVVIEEKEGIIYLQNLENQDPGYYPYTLKSTENSDLIWLSLGKTTGLQIGDVICVGTATNMDEVFESPSGNHFGKIENIVTTNEGVALVSLSCPDTSELFDELNVYTQQDFNFEDENVTLPDDFETQVVSALKQSDDFAEFLGASSMASTTYLSNRKLNASVASPTAFSDKVNFDVEKPQIDGNKMTTSIKGEIKVPIKTEKGTELGKISVQFKASLETGIKLDMGYYIRTFFWFPVGVDYFEVRATQTNVVEFSFDIEIDIDYDLEEKEESSEGAQGKYVLNTKTTTYHYASCKHVKSIKDKSKLKKITAENIISYQQTNSNHECGTCQPYQALITTSYVINLESEIFHVPTCFHLDQVTHSNVLVSKTSWQSLEKQGYETCGDCNPQSREKANFQKIMWEGVERGDASSYVDKIKDWSQDGTQSEAITKGIKLCDFRFAFYIFQADIELRLVFHFDFEVSMNYVYRASQTNVVGVKYTYDKGMQTYQSLGDIKQEKHQIDLIGKMEAKLGVAADARVGFVGLTRWINVGMTVEGGVYARANGALHMNFLENEAYVAARFEAGLYLDVDGSYRLLGRSGKGDWLNLEKPFYNWGYDKAYFSFVNRLEELYIDGDYTLGNTEFLTVEYLDVKTLKTKTEKLNQNETQLYKVEFTLQNGTYCQIVDGKLVINTDAPQEFTDTLYVSVYGLKAANDYIKNSGIFFLEQYSVEIVYSNIVHTYQEIERKSATCDEDGYVKYRCSDCGEVKMDALISQGHTLQITVATLPTCETDGNTEGRYCTACQTTLLESRLLPAFGHQLMHVEAKAPTCTESGWENRIDCWNDGCTYSTYDEIPAGHQWENDICNRCDISIDMIFSFKQITDVGCAIIGVKDKTITTINIPKTYKGLDIVSIGGTYYDTTIDAFGPYHVFEGCDNLTKIIIPNSVMTIEYWAFYNCRGLRIVEIPDSVTTIGGSAFKSCSNLTNVRIGDGVIGIGENAFYNCNSLTSVEIGDNVTTIGNSAFYNCSSLTSVVIPDSVTAIESHAFENCSSLISVEIGDNVTTIGSSAFYGCSSLTSVVIPDSVTTIGSYAFSECGRLISAVIPDSVTTIGRGAFSGCSSLTSVVIPDSVTEIESDAFEYCSSLISVEIGGNVTTIGSSAFNCCRKLVEVYNKSSLKIEKGVSKNGYVGYYAKNIYKPASGESKLTTTEEGYVLYTDGDLVSLIAYMEEETDLVLPYYVTEIYDYAFSGCSSLTSVVIPDGVTTIGNGAFYNCSGLTSVVIPDSVTTIGSSAFENCSSLTSIVIPDSVTTIDGYAFRGCSSLTSVVISDSVTTIGENAFSYCSNLTSVEIPDSVTMIGSCTFFGCSSLTSVVIPDNVTMIRYAAFDGCSSLTDIVIPDSVKTIDSYVFDECSRLKNVYYKGTTTEWDSISITSSGNSYLATATRYYYSETQPTESGKYWRFVNGVPTAW